MKPPKLPLRRQYLRIARHALRRGELGWIARQALKTLAVPASARLGRPLGAPLMASFLITWRCNAGCFMCDWPRPWFYERRGTEELDTETAGRVIDQIASLGVAGLAITGGEPTLRGDCFELLARAKAAGLFVNLNTNASTLDDPRRVEALLDTGLDSLNISLDGARAETHDRLRATPGGFERVRRATELILQMRRGGRPTLTYLFAIGPENHAELPEFVALARARAVDSISFIPLLPIYRDHRAPSAEQVGEMTRSVDYLRRARRGGLSDFIDSSDAYLSLFARSWRREPSPLRCYAPYAHLAIDAFGNVYPCGVWLNDDRRVGNVRDTALASLWGSEPYREVRRELADCRACYWNCHTEANLLYRWTGR